MKKLYALLIITIISDYSSAQLISRFNWDTNPVTTAEIGPDAISVSGSATSSS